MERSLYFKVYSAIFLEDFHDGLFLGENEICMATLMQNILFIGGQARYGLAWLILHVQTERGRSVHLALNLIRRSLYKKAAAAQRFTS